MTTAVGSGNARLGAHEMLVRRHESTVGRIRGLSDPSPHPAGHLIAATATVTTDALAGAVQRVHLFRTDDDSAPTDVAPLLEHSTSLPRWSPDGSALAFASDHRQSGVQQVAWYDAATGEVHAAAPVSGSVESIEWLPDSSGVLVVVAGFGAEQAGAMGSGRVPLSADAELDSGVDIRRSGVSPQIHDEWRRAWHIGLESASATCLTPDGPNIWEATWIDEHQIFAVVSDQPAEDAWYGAAAAVVSIEGGCADQLALVTSERQLGVVSSSPAGSTVACIEAPCSDRTLVAGRLVLAATDGSTPARRLGRDVLGLDATHVEWIDEHRLVVSGYVGMRSRVVEIDLDTLDLVERIDTELVVGPRQPEARRTDDGTLVFTAHHWDAPPGVWVAPTGAPLATLWQADHVPGSQARLELRRWTGRDDLELDGYVLLPGGEGPFPTVLYPHGGPVAVHRPGHIGGGWPEVELLLERGYAVFHPNPRGSAGYGWDFADAVHGDMGGEDTHDLLLGVDSLVADGIADPDRLVVMGASYAGYMTCWLVTQTDRFQAASAFAVVTNWVSQHFQSNIPQWGMRFLPDGDRFPHGGHVDRSPVYHAAAVSTPTQLVQGGLDRCCATPQAVEFYEALRQHGVPTELTINPEEAHRRPTGERLVAEVDAVVGWFDQWLEPPHRADSVAEAPHVDPHALTFFDAMGVSPVLTRVGPATVDATFVVPISEGAPPPLLAAGFNVGSASSRRLLRVDATTAARTYRLPSSYFGTYLLWHPDADIELPDPDEELLPLFGSVGRVDIDRNNRALFSLPTDPDNPDWPGMSFSIIRGPDAPGIPNEGETPSGEVEEHRLVLLDGEPERRIWTYATPGLEDADDPALLVLFDGGLYAHAMSTPAQLDALVSAGDLPPTLAVFCHPYSDERRNDELSLDRAFSAAVAGRLVDWAAAHWPVSTDPRRSIVGGFSLGGIGALGVGLWHPERFGNVIAQSSPWGVGPVNESVGDDASAFWIADEWERIGSRSTRVYIEMGSSELTFDETARFGEQLRRAGVDVDIEAYHGGHDYVAWASTLPRALRSIVRRW